MNRHLFAELAILTTAFAGLLAAPSALAERECLTVADTEHFVVTYAVGYETWAQALAGLNALDCPGIIGVLCKYWSQLAGASTLPAACLVKWHVIEVAHAPAGIERAVRALPSTGPTVDAAAAPLLP